MVNLQYILEWVVATDDVKVSSFFKTCQLKEMEANSYAAATYNLQLLRDTNRYFESVSSLLCSVGSHLPGVCIAYYLHENVE